MNSKALTLGILILTSTAVLAQQQTVTVSTSADNKKVDIAIGGKPFTSFLYPDNLEKPVLYPIRDAAGTIVTRSFPLDKRDGDPTDHPHHIGLWLNYENVNGLDFWNNSYAIPAAKKSGYGWIKTDKVLEAKSGKTGLLTYHANWTNQANNVLLEETTQFKFSGTANQRVIDRTTTLKAMTDVKFNDAKDGMLGLRLAHELQIPTKEDQKFTDDKGIVTVVKGSTDNLANGNYLTSAGKTGDDAWSTRGVWCKVYGKIGTDSVSIAIIDHPKNPNYPTFWHARGYGLFAANPLGEKIFTNGKSEKNLTLKKGESVTFKYRIVINNGSTPSAGQLNKEAAAFAKK
ncbi:MAG: Methane oxygenase PmoA [Mucilaginibacter sp.]|nr:Methane oxygenase PmoA [Mucilaginibacter sp.]